MKRLCRSLCMFVITLSFAVVSYASAAPTTGNTCTSQQQSKNIFSCACGETDSTANSVACKTTAEDPVNGPSGVLTKAENIIAIVSGVAAIIIIMVSGLKFVTANGDAQKVASARGTLLNALIGIAIIVLANAIVVFIVKGL